MTPETAEKREIKDYLNAKGIFFYHNLAGLGAYKGVADLTAIRDGVCYQIEVKVGKGRQSEWQKVFQNDWDTNGGVYICGDCDEVKRIIK